MSQVNVNDPGGYRDDDGARWLLPLILGLLALAAIAWLLFANPFAGPTASPATGTGVTNVAPATGGTGMTGTGSTTSPGTTGTTGAGTTGTSGTGAGTTTGGTGTTTGGTGTTGTSGTGTGTTTGGTGGTTAPAAKP